MAAGVVNDQPEVFRQRLHLVVPHAVSGAERVRQHHGGSIGAATTTANIDCGHVIDRNHQQRYL